MYQLLTMPRALGLAGGGRMAHHYYEQGHGKNQSDRLGAVGKEAYLRGMGGESWDQSPTIMEEVAAILQRNLPCEGKVTELTRVVVVPPLQRPTKEEGEVPVKGIQKLHSLVLTKEGSILGTQLTCQACILRQVKSSLVLI